jgi:2-polyprenyl-6-hydroxyphenyl methylase/3-demethylubiquinone-9 3-methyltransferase
MTDTRLNADPAELRKFESIASRWWDPTSEFRPLHEINPLRLDYVDQRAALHGKTVLDVGCGGGILAESMAARGAKVTGIDLGGANIEVARLHLLESGLEVDYREVAVEQLADESPASFDVVTCMEMLEHVPDPASVIAACGRLVKPGGLVFLSTINRNPKAYLYAVVGAEYVLGMLPKGTHDYAKFIRPSELGTWLRAAGLDLEDMTGLTYNPLTGVYALEADDVSVNYMACARRPLDG